MPSLLGDYPGVLPTAQNTLDEERLRRGLLNIGTALPAGTLGFLGDVVNPITQGVTGLMDANFDRIDPTGQMRGMSGFNLQAPSVFPTSESVQRSMGGDPTAPESFVGLLGSPDPGDLMRLAPKLAGGLLGMTLFHGTPHKFSKFSLDKIGTGEGAQAFGHGLYFAENPGVAKSYQGQLTDFGLELDGQALQSGGRIPHVGREVEADREVLQRISDAVFNDPQKRGLDGVREAAQGQVDMFKNIDGADEIVQENQQILDALDKYKGRLKDAEGHLYEVEIPDELVERMLDWDAPLSEQPELNKAVSGIVGYDFLEKAPKAKGRDVYAILSMKAGDFGYSSQKGQEAASKLLNQAGIPGIRFYDGQSRGAAQLKNNPARAQLEEMLRNAKADLKQGYGNADAVKDLEERLRKMESEYTRNIVVFNPDDITQVKRDGEIVFKAK